ncbi:hypothetical protein DFH07DRAFT_568155 [Mycena maculata]|uniref:Uncharacterized protein n=1 Tax=Mycena maculata TaxID=230809 RepID=A0AAD7NWA9_9AGAR|nr:hypothetical protein DFH07DRAFT_568155 [Mycena maculata]
MHFRASSLNLALQDTHFTRPYPITTSGYKELMPSPIASSSSSPLSPARASYEPTARRGDAAPFYMHEDSQDSFYSSRKSSTDMEAGWLVPSDADAAVPDLTADKTSRRGIYAAYRRWFARGATVQLGVEKGSDREPRFRTTVFERRLQTGSWCAMVVLILLTVYFLIRER